MNDPKAGFGKQVAGAIHGMPAAATALFEAVRDASDGARQVREGASRTLDRASAATKELTSVVSAAEALAESGQEIGKRLADIANSARAAVPRPGASDGRVEVAYNIGEIARMVGVIAAAAERQAAGTRAMAGTVQMALAGAVAATEAMREVLVIAESVDASSATAARAAETFGDLAETLWSEASSFLNIAEPEGDAAKARAYERLTASGFQANLSIAGGAPVTAEILDISRSGIALAYQCRQPLGTAAEITLPTGGSVGVRVARAAHGVTGFAFVEDDLASAEVEVERMLHLMILSGVGQQNQSAA